MKESWSIRLHNYGNTSTQLSTITNVLDRMPQLAVISSNMSDFLNVPIFDMFTLYIHRYMYILYIYMYKDKAIPIIDHEGPWELECKVPHVHSHDTRKR